MYVVCVYVTKVLCSVRICGEKYNLHKNLSFEHCYEEYSCLWGCIGTRLDVERHGWIISYLRKIKYRYKTDTQYVSNSI